MFQYRRQIKRECAMLLSAHLPYLSHIAHPEKYFVESTKIWFAQQSFSFKYCPMDILFELTKKILLIFLQFQQKNFAFSAKKLNFKLKLQNYYLCKESILLIQVKLKTFC